MEEFDADLWLLPVDAKVHDPKRYGREDLPIRARVCGGGGTSFRPPFEWVGENDITPDVLVYLTDGKCRDYPDEPYYPVLWMTCGKPMKDAPFGRV